MSIADKLTTIAENMDKVYEAGKASMVDEEKIMEKTVSGVGSLLLSDVSEVPHKVLCNKAVTVSTGEHIPYPYVEKSKTVAGITWRDNGDGTITLKGTATGTAYFNLVSNASPYRLKSGVYTLTYGEEGIEGVKLHIGGSKLSVSAACPASTFYVTDDVDVWLYFSVASGTSLEETTLRPRLVWGEKVPAFHKKRYEAGEMIPSLSPCMLIEAEDKETPLSVTYCISYGNRCAWDSFWDRYQRLGTRTDYTYAFSGMGWEDETFRPKYDLLPAGAATGMFMSSKCHNIKESLGKCGIRLDTSAVTNAQNMFNYIWSAELPEIDAQNATSVYAMFAYSANLKRVDKFIFGEKNGYPTNFVLNCTALEHFLAEGTIAVTGFDFSPCTKLSHESIMSIIGCLKDYKGSGATYTVTLGATNLAKLSDAEKAIATQKGWSLA